MRKKERPIGRKFLFFAPFSRVFAGTPFPDFDQAPNALTIASTSPATSRDRLGGNPAFGKFEDVPFQDVLAACAEL